MRLTLSLETIIDRPVAVSEVSETQVNEEDVCTGLIEYEQDRSKHHHIVYKF